MVLCGKLPTNGAMEYTNKGPTLGQSVHKGSRMAHKAWGHAIGLCDEVLALEQLGRAHKGLKHECDASKMVVQFKDIIEDFEGRT